MESSRCLEETLMPFLTAPVGNVDTFMNWAGNVFPRMGFLFEPARYMKGMQNFLSMMHESGVTTAADMGTGIFGNAVSEIQAVKAAVANDPVGVAVSPPSLPTSLRAKKRLRKRSLKFANGKR